MRTLPVTAPLACLLALAGSAAAAGPLVANPPQIVFPNAGNGVVPAPVKVTFTNAGGGIVNITAIDIGGANPTDFGLDVGLFAPPFAIGPGASLTVSVRFAPGAAGQKGADLVVRVGGGLGDCVVPLSGLGVGNAPVLSVVPPMVVFGTVGLFAKSVQWVNLSNLGLGTLNLKDFRLLDPMNCGCFQVNNAPMQDMNGNWPTLKPAQILAFNVVCSPQAAGLLRGELDIDSDDPNTPHVVVPISCTGAVAEPKVDPASVDFGAVSVGASSAPTMVTLTNGGAAPITVTAVTLGGANAARFHFDDPGRFDLAGGQSKVIPVSCTPVSAGELTASLIVTPAGFPSAQVKLQCTGSQRQLIFDSGQSNPGALDFDTRGQSVIGAAPITLLVEARVPMSSLPVTLNDIKSSDRQFQLDLSETTRTLLMPGDTTHFRVSFRPDTIGPQRATLSALVDGEPKAVATLEARGTGAEAIPLVTSPGDGCSLGTRRADARGAVLLSLAGLVAIGLRRRRRA